MKWKKLKIKFNNFRLYSWAICQFSKLLSWSILKTSFFFWSEQEHMIKKLFGQTFGSAKMQMQVKIHNAFKNATILQNKNKQKTILQNMDISHALSLFFIWSAHLTNSPRVNLFLQLKSVLLFKLQTWNMRKVNVKWSAEIAQLSHLTFLSPPH